ncbi:MAG TPA: hypothetical protein QGH28_06775 [Chloroflexota bacterium]|nr:hypothetical protein [Chloroflexota bacterium]
MPVTALRRRQRTGLPDPHAQPGPPTPDFSGDDLPSVSSHGGGSYSGDTSPCEVEARGDGARGGASLSQSLHTGASAATTSRIGGAVAAADHSLASAAPAQVVQPLAALPTKAKLEERAVAMLIVGGPFPVAVGQPSVAAKAMKELVQTRVGRAHRRLLWQLGLIERLTNA